MSARTLAPPLTRAQIVRTGCPGRRATNVPLDDITFVARHPPPHRDRDDIWRIRKAEGLDRKLERASERSAKG